MDFDENTASKEAEDELNTIGAELAYRELARRYYAEYLAYVGGGSWKRTRMSEYIAQEVQDFLTTDTGHAYDILVIETPPQHGNCQTKPDLAANRQIAVLILRGRCAQQLLAVVIKRLVDLKYIIFSMCNKVFHN